MRYLDASELAPVVDEETPVTDIVALLRSRTAQKAEAIVYYLPRGRGD